MRYNDGTDRPEFYERLGWELPLLTRLDGLRAVVDGGAAKAMDLVPSRLAGHRREWEKRAATRPAANAPAGATAGTRESFKGWELYAWHHEGETYRSLLARTNRRKSADEIEKAAVGGVDPAKARLAALKAGQYVRINGRKIGEEPPQPAVRQIADYCKGVGLRQQ